MTDFLRSPFAIFPVGADKRPLVTGWQSAATRDPAVISRWQASGAKAWGIPCGAANDLFVVDLDVDKETGEAMGEMALAATRYAYLIDLANVVTPSGGKHIYLRHFESARNSTSKLGQGIDTRGEGGYVVAPGSMIGAGVYTGHLAPERGLAPVGLRARLLQAPMPRKFFHTLKNVEAPRSEVEALLRFLPPDMPYADWLAVLMALHHRFNGSDEGLEIADRWSANGAKYRAGEVKAKWNGFGRQGVTWATIPAMARQHGADLSQIAREHSR